MGRHPVSRRGFLQAAAMAAAGSQGWLRASWRPSVRVGRDRAAVAAPPAFPERIPLYQQAYENWSGEIFVPDVWTAAPRSADEVVEIAKIGKRIEQHFGKPQDIEWAVERGPHASIFILQARPETFRINFRF